MNHSDSFANLLIHLRQGDDDAAIEVWNRFSLKLICEATKRFDARLRQKVDPEDVVLSVFRSVFARCKQGQWEIGNWNSFWGLLMRITERKCKDVRKHFYRQCRDLNKENQQPKVLEGSRDFRELQGSEPTPEAVAILQETLDSLLHRLDDELNRRIVEYSLSGYTTKEIGAELDVAERTVRRVREQVRKYLQKMLTEVD